MLQKRKYLYNCFTQYMVFKKNLFYCLEKKNPFELPEHARQDEKPWLNLDDFQEIQVLE